MIGPAISVKDLAAAMELAASEVIKKLMALGVMSTINQDIDFETAQIIGTGDDEVFQRVSSFKAELASKVVSANAENIIIFLLPLL